MKRCPTCNRTFADDSQKFCLDDGATLNEESQQSFDPQATIAMPGGQAPPPASNPYGSGAGQGSFGSGSAGPGSYGSGAGQGSYASGAGPGSYGSGAGQGGFGSGAGQGGYASGGQGQQQAPSWSPSPPAYGASTPPKKKSVLPWVLGIGAVLLVGAIGLVVAIVLIASSSSNSNNSNNSNSNRSNSNSNSNKSNSNSTASSGVPIISPDGKIRITAPTTWKSSTELNDKAELQASDSSNQMYLIVLTDAKANYGSSMSIDDHSEETLGTLTRSMTSSTKTGPTNITIDGSPALQYVVRGEIKGLNVVYLHTTVETSKNFHQIVAWTLQTTYDAKKEVLQDVVQSFKETSP